VAHVAGERREMAVDPLDERRRELAEVASSACASIRGPTAGQSWLWRASIPSGPPARLVGLPKRARARFGWRTLTSKFNGTRDNLPYLCAN